MKTKWQFKNYQEFKKFEDTYVTSSLNYSTSPVFGSKDIFVRIWVGTPEELEEMFNRTKKLEDLVTYTYGRTLWKPLIWGLSFLTYDSDTKRWDVV